MRELHLVLVGFGNVARRFTGLLTEHQTALARDHGRMPDSVYDSVAAALEPRQVVALTALGAMMIATNVFNNALEVELDEYLGVYRQPGSAR